MICEAIVTTNQRRAQRFPLEWQVLLQEGGQGHTRDISSSGVYFETDQPLREQSLICFVLVSPSQMDSKDIFCEGRVVRLEQQNRALGVGVMLERFSFGVSRREAPTACPMSFIA